MGKRRHKAKNKNTLRITAGCLDIKNIVEQSSQI